MPLKKSHGNMYDWVTHMHSHLAGECPHRCGYCYVGRGRGGRPPRYVGNVRIIKEEMMVNYGAGKTIFIEHMSDMFAEGVPTQFVRVILAHCQAFPNNTYVFQTKDPARALSFYLNGKFPREFMIGTTIETNFDTLTGAPEPRFRLAAIKAWKALGAHTFVTIEPVMKFDSRYFPGWFTTGDGPDFVNIGADSKGSGLSEPTAADIRELLNRLADAGVKVRRKTNLERILGK